MEMPVTPSRLLHSQQCCRYNSLPPKKVFCLSFYQIPSNVVRINRALVRHDFRGKPQIAYYQAGVGSGPSFFNKITGGLLGAGISEVSLLVYTISFSNLGNRIFAKHIHS